MADESDIRAWNGAEPDATFWGDVEQFDPLASDAFSQEIANISESDWDLDADEIWGDLDGGQDGGVDPSGPEFFV
ncbi:hypothetical protein AB0N64_04135 [Microbacterium sp. NPDC089318]